MNIWGWSDRDKRHHLASVINLGKFDFICLQEPKREVIEESQVGLLWGNQPYDWLACWFLVC